MRGFLLHVGATVNCSHGGDAQPTTPNLRVTVMGQPTVTLAAPYVVRGCGLPPPPAGIGPCLTAQFLKGSVRVTSFGQPLLLDSSPAICEPTGAPLHIAATQTRVMGI
jgi:hypothetical protein